MNDVVVDTTWPTASFATGGNVTTPGSTPYQFFVQYSDPDDPVSVATLTTGDIEITGPGGSWLPTLISKPGSHTSPANAAYSLNPPGGSWDYSDNGTYYVRVRSNEVSDTHDNWTPAGEIGQFQVAISPPPPEITVSGNGQNITDGDTTPSLPDWTDFGSVLQGQPGPTRTFTVRNDGGTTLTLGAPSLPSGFTLVEGLSGGAWLPVHRIPSRCGWIASSWEPRRATSTSRTTIIPPL